MNNIVYGEINAYQIKNKSCKSLGMKDSTILDLVMNFIFLIHRFKPTENSKYQYLVSTEVFYEFLKQFYKHVCCNCTEAVYFYRNILS